MRSAIRGGGDTGGVSRWSCAIRPCPPDMPGRGSAAGPVPELPTALLHVLHAQGDDALSRWAATAWPAGREPFFAGGFERIAGLESAMWDARLVRPYLEP